MPNSQTTPISISVPDGTFTINLNPGGAATIESTLKEVCPNCDCTDCYINCDGSKSVVAVGDGQSIGLESLTETVERYVFNARIDAIESFLLSLACHGPLPDKIWTPLQDAIDACGQHGELPEELAATLGEL